ncbi:MAG: RNA methyltransferase [Bacteroidales bacterium]|nr:RNA methyltransferase [Bacteroidales bacterium]
MISKAKLKSLASYKMQKVCDLDGVFVVEGVKMCDEALQSGATIRAICATHPWIEAHADAAQQQEVPLFEITDAELERISNQKTPNQVWMLLSRPTSDEHQLPAAPLTLVLDKIQDPGNMGTIMRTADWFGIRTIVCSRDTVSCYNPKVVQSTMGAIFRTRVVYTDLDAFLAQRRQEGYTVYGALLEGDNVYQTTLVTDKALLVIGNESQGITAAVRDCIDRPVMIPNRGGSCESLNASVATAILCSEFLRRQE